jgi:hypothetical protein
MRCPKRPMANGADAGNTIDRRLTCLWAPSRGRITNQAATDAIAANPTMASKYRSQTTRAVVTREYGPDASRSRGAVSASSISSPTSPISRSRYLSSFSRHRRNSRRMATGTSPGRASRSGSRVNTLAMASDGVVPSKARRPVSIS